MIKEAYCSDDVCKLLKEKGFKEPCTALNQLVIKDGEKPFMKVTHQKAMAWLREHGLHINAPISYDYSVDADGNEVDRWTFYMFEIYSSFSGNLIYTEEVNEYNSYEEAVEAAIKYCLENLI